MSGISVRRPYPVLSKDDIGCIHQGALRKLEKVRIGGILLGQRHTASHPRSEHFLPKLVDRRSYDLWAAAGRKPMEERAREMVRQALARPPPNPLAPEVVQRLDALIDGARDEAV